MECIIKLIMLCAIVTVTVAFIGYDCAGGKPNITTISLLEVHECQKNVKALQQTETYIQLIQTADHTLEHVFQCKVEVNRHITHCGMHSHASEVRGGHGAYILQVGKQVCWDMHKFRKYHMQHNIIFDGLRPNATVHRTSVIAGSINYDGACSGSEYSDQFGNWQNVVVQAVISITLADYDTPVQLSRNIVRMRSGTVCPYLEYTCIDSEGGESYWNEYHEVACDRRKYLVLYEGPAVAVAAVDEDTQRPNRTIYTVTTRETTFALSVLTSTYICNQPAYQTEHPKLQIITGNPGSFTLRKQQLIPENMDIFTYINSKLVYVEKHVSREMTSLFMAVQNQKCELERQVLRNLLNLAVIAPDQFAYNHMKAPGYTAIVAGEVVHVIQCVPVEVKVRKTSECYHELPVTYGNKSYFLTPRNHILQLHGTQLECNPFTSPMYSLYGTWYKTTPDIVETLPPNTLRPVKVNAWTYKNPGELATNGIYTLEDLSRLSNQYMFPAERQAVLNTLSRSIAGSETNLQGLQIQNVFTPEAMDKIISNSVERMWGWFSSIGTFTSGVLGIWMAVKLTKYVVETIIHGWSLYKALGVGIHLLGACWSTVANLLLYTSGAARKRTPTFESSPNQEVETGGNTEPTAPPSNAENSPAEPYQNVVIQLKQLP